MPKYYADDDEPWIDKRPDPALAKAKRPDALWVVHMSHGGRAVERALKEGFICVGWVEAGDLRRYPSQEAMKAAFWKHYPEEKDGRIAHWAGDALRFVDRMQVGEHFVFAAPDAGLIHLGKVTGGYEHRADDADLWEADSANVRRVEWLGQLPREKFATETIECFDARHTIHDGSAHREEVLRLFGVTS